MRHVQTRLPGFYVGLFCCLCAASDANVIRASERIAIEVGETAGIRRFQYPVAVQLKLAEPVPRETRFRLLREDVPVIAQFRAAEEGGAVARW